MIWMKCHRDDFFSMLYTIFCMYVLYVNKSDNVILFYFCKCFDISCDHYYIKQMYCFVKTYPLHFTIQTPKSICKPFWGSYNNNFYFDFHKNMYLHTTI